MPGAFECQIGVAILNTCREPDGECRTFTGGKTRIILLDDPASGLFLSISLSSHCRLAFVRSVPGLSV